MICTPRPCCPNNTVQKAVFTVSVELLHSGPSGLRLFLNAASSRNSVKNVKMLVSKTGIWRKYHCRVLSYDVESTLKR